MKKLIIAKEINESTAVSMRQGANLYALLIKAMEEKEQVELSFEGLEVISSPFFNASISYLLKDYSIKEVLEIIKIDKTTLPEYALQILNISIDNALSLYNKK